MGKVKKKDHRVEVMEKKAVVETKLFSILSERQKAKWDGEACCAEGNVSEWEMQSYVGGKRPGERKKEVGKGLLGYKFDPHNLFKKRYNLEAGFLLDYFWLFDL